MSNNYSRSVLAGKRVVVVGASSGMGLAVAKASAEQGAHLILCSRSLERLNHVKADVGGSAEVFQVDMLEEASVNALFEQIGKLDHLIVTAIADEVKLYSRFVEMSTETAKQSLDKLWGSFFLARAAAPHIQLGGSITLTSSVAAFSPPPNGGYAMMNAASAAVASLGRSLAAELKPIRVNVVAPGSVNTGVWQNMSAEDAARFREQAGNRLPVQHLGEPEELAQAFLFLMTNTYTTGTILTVDGGAMLT